MITMPIFGLFLRLPKKISAAGAVLATPILNEPEVELAITMRSGPIVVEIEYQIKPENARAYYKAMLKIQRIHLRNGGFDWSISRDIADPKLWIERYHCPTWADYLRMRDRLTQSDMDAHSTVDEFIINGQQRRVRRGLERPFGSVRWNADTPDTQQDTVAYTGL
jgi:hypothetical protein